MPYKIISLIIVINLITFSQRIYDDKIQFFGGKEYGNSVVVDDTNNKVIVRTMDYQGKIVATHTLSFDQLPFQRYLKIYNSIILLNAPRKDVLDDKLYFYDLITKKKSDYFENTDNQYLNRYSEEIQLGRFNPVIRNNELIIINDKLEVIAKLNLKGHWILLSDSNTMVGYIRLRKLIKQGEYTANDKWEEYAYDVYDKRLIKE